MYFTINLPRKNDSPTLLASAPISLPFVFRLRIQWMPLLSIKFMNGHKRRKRKKNADACHKSRGLGGRGSHETYQNYCCSKHSVTAERVNLLFRSLNTTSYAKFHDNVTKVETWEMVRRAPEEPTWPLTLEPRAFFHSNPRVSFAILSVQEMLKPQDTLLP